MRRIIKVRIKSPPCPSFLSAAACTQVFCFLQEKFLISVSFDTIGFIWCSVFFKKKVTRAGGLTWDLLDFHLFIFIQSSAKIPRLPIWWCFLNFLICLYLFFCFTFSSGFHFPTYILIFLLHQHFQNFIRVLIIIFSSNFPDCNQLFFTPKKVKLFLSPHQLCPSPLETRDSRLGWPPFHSNSQKNERPLGKPFSMQHCLLNHDKIKDGGRGSVKELRLTVASDIWDSESADCSYLVM
jgi:hypothetical protein